MFRFDAKKGFYLYPQSRSDDNIELRMNSGTTYEKMFGYTNHYMDVMFYV